MAQLIGNGSRVWFNRQELDWHVVAWFALGDVPMAFLGALLFAKAPLSTITRVLGGFLILIVIWRHVRSNAKWRPTLAAFAGIGAGASFLCALLGSVGPLMAPFLIAYGLVKGAYIGTEALSTVVMHVIKLIAYRHAAILPSHAITIGALLGPVMLFGSFTGIRIVDRLPEKVFILIIEGTLLAAGLLFLWRG